MNPPRVRYTLTWDVSAVLDFLSTLYPLEDLSLKMLTYKLDALIALTTAARAQTLLFLDTRYMHILEDSALFEISKLIKTTRLGFSNCPITLKKFSQPELCVFRTLLCYLDKFKELRKSSSLLESFSTFKVVTTCTLAGG